MFSAGWGVGDNIRQREMDHDRATESKWSKVVKTSFFLENARNFIALRPKLLQDYIDRSVQVCFIKTVITFIIEPQGFA